MTKGSENLHPEQSSISKLYQSLKVEEPSAQIDENILTQAKLQLESQVHKGGKVSSIKTRRSWRKWQWPVSVAASALFISLIFVGQYKFFSVNHTVYPDAEQVDIEAFEMARPAQSMSDKAGSTQLDAEQEQVTVQVMGQRIAKEQAQLYATEQQVTQQTRKLMAAPNQEPSHIVSAQIAQLQHELNTKLVLLTAVNNKQKDLFTDSVLAELKEANSSVTNAEKHELQEQITLLQIALIEQMQNKLKIQPQWQAPQALLDLLSPAQQAQWAEQNKQEHKE
jgi:hypothetical protein